MSVGGKYAILAKSGENILMGWQRAGNGLVQRAENGLIKSLQAGQSKICDESFVSLYTFI